tara:strand:- start:848 stop:1744 length:897 start_codon:yes stop_codon:yes gene_type:complete
MLNLYKVNYLNSVRCRTKRKLLNLSRSKTMNTTKTKSYLDKSLEVASYTYKVYPKDELYHQLETLNGNRDVDDPRVTRLEKSIKEGNLLHLVPIIIRKRDSSDYKITYYIVDGQHRCKAAKNLSLPFFVTEDNGTDVNSIIRLNTNQRNWSLKNYAKYWATVDGKSEAYSKYLEYKENYDVTYGTLIAIWNGSAKKDTEDGGNKKFKEGELTFNNKIRKHVNQTLSKLDQLKDAATNPPLTKRTVTKQQFQHAFLKAFEKPCFNFDTFLGKLCKTSHRFNELGKQNDMEKEIYRIERS